MLAKSIDAVLVGGKQISDVPVIFDLDRPFVINKKTAEAIGLEIPFEVLSTTITIE